MGGSKCTRYTVPDASKSSCGTATNQVTLPSCSCKKQRYVYSSGPHTGTSYQDIKESAKRSDDLRRSYTRTSNDHPRKCVIMQPSLQSIFNILMQRTSGEGFQQDLHKIFSQGPVIDHALQGPLGCFILNTAQMCSLNWQLG